VWGNPADRQTDRQTEGVGGFVCRVLKPHAFHVRSVILATGSDRDVGWGWLEGIAGGSTAVMHSSHHCCCLVLLM